MWLDQKEWPKVGKYVGCVNDISRLDCEIEYRDLENGFEWQRRRVYGDELRGIDLCLVNEHKHLKQ